MSSEATNNRARAQLRHAIRLLIRDHEQAPNFLQMRVVLTEITRGRRVGVHAGATQKLVS